MLKFINRIKSIKKVPKDIIQNIKVLIFCRGTLFGEVVDFDTFILHPDGTMEIEFISNPGCECVIVQSIMLPAIDLLCEHSILHSRPIHNCKKLLCYDEFSLCTKKLATHGIMMSDYISDSCNDLLVELKSDVESPLIKRRHHMFRQSAVYLIK